jgi:hypothetical protein
MTTHGRRLAGSGSKPLSDVIADLPRFLPLLATRREVGPRGLH